MSSASEGGRPMWLPLEPDPVLAFLHEGRGRRSGVLLCPPFGWQEMCSYRRRRRWAQALGDAGFPALRIDLPGTGDSPGGPSQGNRVEAWTAALVGAATWLREGSDIERVVAIGIGLGGLLACLAAAEGAAIDDLILWAVPRQGRLLLRELRAYASVVATRFGDERHAAAEEGGLELTGFRLSAETVTALSAVNLTGLALPPRDPPRRILLLGHDGFDVDGRLREHLEAYARVSVDRGDDYEVLMAHPQDARVADETIARTVAWVAEGEPAACPPRRASRRPPSSALSEVHLNHGEAELVEATLELDGGCFGVLTTSADAPSAEIGAVWLNGGALRHTGPNRTWVEVARRWAARGVPTARIDLAGIGDADGDERTSISNAGLYAPERHAETLAILDQLAARGVAERFVLGGLCSGAYWALHAALADTRVVSALMVNLYAFFWDDGLVAERETRGSIQALQGNAWRRLWRRDLTADQLRTAIASIRPARLRAGAGHPVERAQRPALEHVLDRLRDHGTDALLLLSRGEPLFDQLVRAQVIERRERWPNLVIEQIPSRDHLFRALALQARVHGALDGALERVLARQIARPHAASR